MEIYVSQILQKKGTEVWTVGPDMMVIDALALMAEKGIGAVLVTEGRKVVGVLSERDYARKIILVDRSSRETRVAEIMTAKVLYVAPETSAEECLMVMTAKRVRHLPVIKDGGLAGVISIGDVVGAMLSSQQNTIEQLVRYIQGY